MTSTIPNPLALIAELTHRCPLHCVYCSNPLEMQSRANELSTEIWSRVFKEAAEAGVLQADFTGGEPLARPDIIELVPAARSAGLYVNLITSRLGLRQPRKSFADTRTAGSSHCRHQTRTGAAGRQDSRRIRRPRLLRKISQALHGWLGPQADADHARRGCASVPRRASHSRHLFRKYKRSQPARDLGMLRRIPEIPRRTLDAGTFQNLRPPRAGFRRLPLSGIASGRRRLCHRSRLLARAAAPPSRRDPSTPQSCSSLCSGSALLDRSRDTHP